MPLSVTTSGPAPVENVNVCGATAPIAVGLKVTEAVQLSPGARVLPQLFVWAKFPVAWTTAMPTFMPPVLDSCTVCAGDVALRGTLPKSKALTLRLTAIAGLRFLIGTRNVVTASAEALLTSAAPKTAVHTSRRKREDDCIDVPGLIRKCPPAAPKVAGYRRWRGILCIAMLYLETKQFGVTANPFC